MDIHGVKVVEGNETVGHLPHKFSRIALYFLARSGEISVEVIGRRGHCEQVCGGMAIPCQLEFTGSKKIANETLERTTSKRNDQQQVSVCLIFIH